MKLIELAQKLSGMNGHFFALTKKRAEEIGLGTKGIDATVAATVYKARDVLEYENPFPTVVESQGNVFEYEDFTDSYITSEVIKSTERIAKYLTK